MAWTIGKSTVTERLCQRAGCIVEGASLIGGIWLCIANIAYTPIYVGREKLTAVHEGAHTQTRPTAAAILGQLH